MEISRQTHGLFVGNAHYENDLTETTSSNVDLLNNCLTPMRIHLKPEMLAETIESDPLCITDLFQNKSVAYF